MEGSNMTRLTECQQEVMIFTFRLSRSTLLISWSFSSSIELMSFLMSAVLKLLAFNDINCL